MIFTNGSAPQAEFGVSCGNLRCAFTDRSSDDDGADASRVHTAKPRAVPPPSPPLPPANKPPKADFEVRCKKRKCDFTDESKDADGRIVAWRWNFGDGTSSQERNGAHRYDESGKYTVALTVTR